ncbi:MAG: exopolyphosphatase-related protein [Cyanobacteria bacterium RYN_339]|nr:exopolyphosphatase-related protein [Cyanobacteria bacterium RYN_339]
MDAVSTVRDLAHVAELLKAHDRYLIVPHVAPDPDAYGSTCALALMLRQLGKTVMLYSDEPVPVTCVFLTEWFPVVHELPPDQETWKLIFVDGGELTREPGPVRTWRTWMNLDHHLDNGRFAEWIYVDTRAAASALVIARLIDPLGITLDEPIASCLFTGILFDTRNAFITDKCDQELFETIGRLVGAGARPDHLNRQLNEQMTMADFKLYGEALAGLSTAMDGKVVYTTLTRAMMDAAGGGDQAMEMLTLNLPKIAGGEIFILFKEASDGSVKVSLRSKGRLAVNELAKRFNGGGHKFAAGARFTVPMAEAVKTLVAACEEVVAAPQP